MKVDMILFISGWTILLISVLFLCFKISGEFIEKNLKNDALDEFMEEIVELLKKIEKKLK